MPRIKAARELEQAAIMGRPVSADRLYDLTLIATGDEKQASAAFRAYRHAELKAGQTPTGYEE